MIDKAAIQALIDAYIIKTDTFITTNGVKAISGAQLNEILNEGADILEQLKASYFNLLDEPRTALSVSYTPVGNPLNWNGGVAPATQNLVNDELAQRLTDFETNNASDLIAYVSVSGSDVVGEFELGNPLKPFATFTAALNALPSSTITNARVVALGGAFSENIVISNKNNLTLDIRNITLTGSVNITSTSAYVNIDARGSIITRPDSDTIGYTLTTSGLNCTILGGRWNRGLNQAVLQGGQANQKTVIIGSYFRQTVNGTCTLDVRGVYFDSCSFVSSSSTAVFRTNECYYNNCYIERTDGLGQSFLSQNFPCVLRNCTLKGSVGGETNLIGRFENCIINATTTDAVTMSGNANAYFKNCTIIGSQNCVRTSNSGTAESHFEQCYLYAGSGAIFNEPAYSVIGKKIYSINSVYNKTFTPSVVSEQRVFEFGKTEIVGLLPPPLLPI